MNILIMAIVYWFANVKLRKKILLITPINQKRRSGHKKNLIVDRISAVHL